VSIADEVRGAGRHRARSFLHFAPGVAVAASKAGPLTLRTSTPTSVEEGQVSTGFGQLHDSATVVVSTDGDLPLRLEVELALLPSPAEGGS
jgi:hypothetical protein